MNTAPAATVTPAAATPTTVEYVVERGQGHDGKGPLELTTKIPLGRDRRELRICTVKRSLGGIAADARVVQISECGRFASYASGLRGDFQTIVERRQVRGTEKALLDLHMTALAKAEELLASARSYYNY